MDGIGDLRRRIKAKLHRPTSAPRNRRDVMKSKKTIRKDADHGGGRHRRAETLPGGARLDFIEELDFWSSSGRDLSAGASDAVGVGGPRDAASALEQFHESSPAILSGGGGGADADADADADAAGTIRKRRTDPDAPLLYRSEHGSLHLDVGSPSGSVGTDEIDDSDDDIEGNDGHAVLARVGEHPPANHSQHPNARRISVADFNQSDGSLGASRRRLAVTTLNSNTSLSSFIGKESFLEWAGTFRRLDPRFQIHDYLVDVALTGAKRIETEGVGVRHTCIKAGPILKAFRMAGIFSVWRPTSKDAIRKMMEGTGTGKGLDVKGKSARRGELSGFVPFVQIHDEKHQNWRSIRTLPRAARIRVFFGPETPGARDEAARRLREIMGEMVRKSDEAKAIMDDPMPSPEERNEAISILSRWDVARPSVDLIDDYASRGCYGVDIPERLLWEAFVMRADTIERGPEGSRYESDRNSEPSFQDMNFGATRGWKGTGPRPVVWQHDTKEPLCPQSLLVAYEEEGRVLPVVSDFDCFLIGTRGVSYDAPLPPDQVEYLQYYVSHIERILDGPDASHSWSTRWFNVLKDAGCKKANKVMLGYGFGDPKSNSIFENAVERLKGCGAVRHGAECFNYYFPQELELDEKFLVISDRLPGNPNVPWTYMNETELRHFLTQKIDQGYTFPLNPKWVLCDPGWKALYDKFAASERYKVKQSFDAWYPPDSGLREKIEEISARHPGGFQRRAFDGRVSCPREMEILSTLPSLKRACGSNFTTERRSEPLIIPLALSELRSQDRTQSVPVKPTVMPEILTSNKRSSHHRPLPELEMVGTEKMDLKLLELERHRVIQRAKRKLRMAIIWINFAKEMKSKTQGKLMRDDAKTIGPTRGLTARDEVESSLAPTSLSAEFFTSGESTLAVSGNDDSADDVQSSAVLTNLPAWLKVTQTKAALHHDFGLKSVVETEPDALPMTLATKPPPPPPPVSRGGSLARGGRRREWTNIGSGSIKLA